MLLVAVFFFPVLTKAQTEMTRKAEITVSIAKKSATYILSGVEDVKVTPAGNYLRIVTFKLDKSHELVKLANPVYIFAVNMRADIDGDGIIETITDEMAVLTRSGNLKFVYHVNGAGSALPVGWDF